MAQRCEHCKFWVDTSYRGQSATGWGVWDGDCANPDRKSEPKERRHSLMHACAQFERGTHPNSLQAAINTQEAKALCQTPQP